MALPQIEKMEKFKETFSTNLFENTAPPPKKRTLLSPKSVVPTTKGKVMTPEEFERLRQQADDDSEEDDEEEDIARDESYQADLEKQRRRQQAALSIYRQQMTKVVGADASPNLVLNVLFHKSAKLQKQMMRAKKFRWRILMAHGFPQTNNRPVLVHQLLNSVNEMSLWNLDFVPRLLAIFLSSQRICQLDPHAMGLPRSSSAYDLRLNTTSPRVRWQLDDPIQPQQFRY